MRQRLFKKNMRNRPDHWRRYGAQKVIHENGGWIWRDDNGSKVFERVAPGTPLPPEPKEPPIMTMEDFFSRRIVQRRKAGSSRRQHSRRHEDDDERSVKSESDSDKDEV
ncbi:hypothetical protein AAVH_43219 [Aphelenchoides avenae]|nr:hypothetical protein AAVH_43219 [Aphelenchus avenae]